MLRSPQGVTVLLPGENHGVLTSLPSSAFPLSKRILTSWPPHGLCCGGLPMQSLLSAEHYPSPPWILVIDTAVQEKNGDGGFEEHHLKGQWMQDFKGAQYWPNLLLLSKKRPTEMSEKYPIWKNKEQKVIGGTAPQHYKGRKTFTGLAAQGNCCCI